MIASKVICVGGVTLDHIMQVDCLPSCAGKTIAHGYDIRGGGMAATAAVAIAGLDGDVQFWGRVGDDMGGRLLLEQLTRANVPTDRVRVCQQAQSATSLVHVDQMGERGLTNFRGKLPDEADWLPLADIAASRAVLGDTRWETGVTAAFETAQDHGVARVLDADAGSPDVLERLIPLADHVIFSAQGLEQLTGPKPVDDALRQISNRFSMEKSVLGVTLGDAGSLWLADATILRVPAIEVRVVNTNGVGDVFHGAYALALAEGFGLRDTIGFATAVAAAKCSMKGGWATMPARHDIGHAT